MHNSLPAAAESIGLIITAALVFCTSLFVQQGTYPVHCWKVVLNADKHSCGQYLGEKYVLQGLLHSDAIWLAAIKSLNSLSTSFVPRTYSRFFLACRHIHVVLQYLHCESLILSSMTHEVAESPNIEDTSMRGKSNSRNCDCRVIFASTTFACNFQSVSACYLCSNSTLVVIDVAHSQ